MNRVFKKVVIVLFSAFILVNFAVNINLLGNALKTSMEQKADFTQTVDAIQQEYISNFKSKNFYINLNGLFARATGKIVHNNTVRLNNGMLLDSKLAKKDVSLHVDSIVEFDNYLKQFDIPFIYVQAPYKMDYEKALLPDGVENYGNESIDDMVSGLTSKGVNVLDLRPYTSNTIEMVEDNFYPTDHHWNVNGAFIGFQKICEKLQGLFPNKNLMNEYVDKSSWDIETYRNALLGSFGRRTGIFFGGMDDLSIMTPKFDTEMSLYVNKYGNFRKGDFYTCNIVDKYIKEEKHPLENDAYCIFIGGDYPLTESYNRNAKADLKVLIIKDSFTRPVQAFMSTIISEIDVIDPRHFKDCTIVEYVQLTKPDVVIFMIGGIAINNKDYMEFGVSSFEEWDETTSTYVLDDIDITIKPKDSSYNSIVMADSLKENAMYKLSLDEIKTLTGNAPAVEVSLYDSENKTHVIRTVIDTDFANIKGGWIWSFITPETNDGSLQLLMYPGEIGKTENIGIEVRNISLKETAKK